VKYDNDDSPIGNSNDRITAILRALRAAPSDNNKSLVTVTPKSQQDETPRTLTPPRENETAGSANRTKNKTQYSDKNGCHFRPT